MLKLIPHGLEKNRGYLFRLLDGRSARRVAGIISVLIKEKSVGCCSTQVNFLTGRRLDRCQKIPADELCSKLK